MADCPQAQYTKLAAHVSKHCNGECMLAAKIEFRHSSGGACPELTQIAFLGGAIPQLIRITKTNEEAKARVAIAAGSFTFCLINQCKS